MTLIPLLAFLNFFFLITWVMVAVVVVVVVAVKVGVGGLDSILWHYSYTKQTHFHETSEVFLCKNGALMRISSLYSSLKDNSPLDLFPTFMALLNLSLDIL